jgi:hypothetical protein
MNYLNQYERELINSLESEIIKDSRNYNLSRLWEYDSIIGGIGAYSMPADPTKNPFKGGCSREIFRPLQYARCNMEILNIAYTTRNIIRDIGLHLEFVLKYILKWNSSLGSIRFNKLTLGGLNQKLYEKSLIDDDNYDLLKNVVKIYNDSKHSINMDIERDSSFTIGDAIIFYIVSRRIATSLLEPYYTRIYKEMTHIEIINRFYINFNREEGLGFVE